MKAIGIGLLAALATLAMGRDAGSVETVHPHTLWVWSAIDGPAIDDSGTTWSVTVRTGGYYTGYAGWIQGEFHGQLSPSQREEFARALERLPRGKRSYRIGAESAEGPGLTLELQYPVPMTRYRVAAVGGPDLGDPTLESVSRVSELLLRLVPEGESHGATPWRVR
jgi:hypothetical protein